MEEGVEEGRTAPTCSNRTDVHQPRRRRPAWFAKTNAAPPVDDAAPRRAQDSAHGRRGRCPTARRRRLTKGQDAAARHGVGGSVPQAAARRARGGALVAGGAAAEPRRYGARDAPPARAPWNRRSACSPRSQPASVHACVRLARRPPRNRVPRQGGDAQPEARGQPRVAAAVELVGRLRGPRVPARARERRLFHARVRPRGPHASHAPPTAAPLLTPAARRPSRTPPPGTARTCTPRPWPTLSRARGARSRRSPRRSSAFSTSLYASATQAHAHRAGGACSHPR